MTESFWEMHNDDFSPRLGECRHAVQLSDGRLIAEYDDGGITYDADDSIH